MAATPLHRGARGGICLGIFLLGFAQFAAAAGWVGVWAAAPQLTEPRNLPPAPGLAGNTLRQVIHLSIGAKKFRVRLSNEFGDGPLEIQRAHVAASARPGAIRPGTDRALLFAGRPSVIIPAGKMIFSDILDDELAPLSDVAVSLQFAQVPRAITGHPGSRATSWLAAGDRVASPELADGQKVEHWYILTGLDALTERPGAAIVTLGDSITDGRGSGTDANNRWPDDLSRRLQAGNLAKVAVLNEGIGGNCVLRRGLGPTALARFDRDVLGQDSVRWTIILEGVNDIGISSETNSAVAGDLIAAYKDMIARARDHGIRSFGATIPPFGGSAYDRPGHEQQRQTVNDWIRHGGAFDGVIDFDAALRDPAQPMRLRRDADSGDHLHPNAAGYETMAGAVDLEWFRN